MTHSTKHPKLFRFSYVELFLMFLLAAALGASSIFAWQEIRYQEEVDSTEQLQIELKNSNQELRQAQKSVQEKDNSLKEVNQYIDELTSNIGNLTSKLETAQASIEELNAQLSTTQDQAAKLNNQAISLEADAQLLTACIRDVYPLVNELNQVDLQSLTTRSLSTASGLIIESIDLRQSWNTGSCQQAQAVLDRYRWPQNQIIRIEFHEALLGTWWQVQLFNSEIPLQKGFQKDFHGISVSSVNIYHPESRRANGLTEKPQRSLALGSP